MRQYIVKRQKTRLARTMRVRKKLRGTALRPRMSVVKSNLHLQVQLIDDESGSTLGSTATFAKEFKGTEFGKKNKLSAKAIGTRIAEIAKEKNISEVIFDRGRHKYHGILAELATAAREAGLKF